MDAERLEQLASIADMYYFGKLTQEQIAARTGYSRSMISKLITEARDQGVVQISINYPLQRNLELEYQLVSSLGVRQARVLKHSRNSFPEALPKVGSLAAKFFSEQLCDGLVVGISWGTALYEAVKALPSHTYNGIKIVQMLGSLGTSNPEIDGPELMWRLADKVSAQYSAFPVPLLVDSMSTKEALFNAPHANKVLDSFKSIELALVGIGTVNPVQASLLRTSYMSKEQLDSIKQAGAVGDVCVIHFDIDGNIINTPLTDLFLGIGLDDFKRIPMRIGVAAGLVKAPAILGASRAGMVNVLITDEIAATEVLKRMEN